MDPAALATGGARRGSTEEELRDVAAELQGTLEDFGVMASVVCCRRANSCRWLNKAV